MSRYAYLEHLLLWTLPVIAGQAFLLWRIYRGRLRALVWAVLPPVLVVSAWLTAADHWAISAGVWRFGEGLHLGIYLGAVPLEEALFFVLTNVLVVQGLALFGWKRLLGRSPA